MKRFFYGAEIHNTWSKLFVLNEDGTLYCEYLDNMRPSKYTKRFDNFDPALFKWHGYQTVVEISYDEAVSTNLTRQQNWIIEYLSTSVGDHIMK